MLARSLPVLHEIVAAQPGDHVLVVSHNATLRLLICSLVGIDPRAYRDCLDLDSGCLNVVDFEGTAHPRLVLFNDTSHLMDQSRKR